MNTISVGELSGKLGSDPEVTLIDVRTPAEFGSAHVPGALNLPLESLSPYALVNGGELPAGGKIYILCQSGTRAEKASARFQQAGFRNTVVVTGGTAAWADAGLPLERGTSRVISLERQVRIGAGSLVLAGAVLGWLIHPAFFGLSAFVGAGLVFAGISDWCGMGLLLARAPWNRRHS